VSFGGCGRGHARASPGGHARAGIDIHARAGVGGGWPGMRPRYVRKGKRAQRAAGRRIPGREADLAPGCPLVVVFFDNLFTNHMTMIKVTNNKSI
jgi:hypothetical protein